MVGSQFTNRMRLTFTLIYLVVINVILFRELLPFSAESSRWLWLGSPGSFCLTMNHPIYRRTYPALLFDGPGQIIPTATGGVVQGGRPHATNERPLRSDTSIAVHKTRP